MQDDKNSVHATPAKPKENVALQALMMAFGTFSSRLLGLMRDQVFVAMFSRTVTDAWAVAFRIPNLFRRLLGEGSLSVSFIPVFVEVRGKDATESERERARNLVNSFYTMLLVILTVLTALGVLYSDLIVGFLTKPEFRAIPGKFELTVRMAQIMFCFIFFMSTYAFFMGILNSFGKFGLAGAAPALFNVAMICSNFVPKAWQPVEGDAVAVGVVLGGLLQTAILVPSLIRLGYFPKLSLLWNNPDAKRVWKAMIPGMLGMGMMQIATVINTQFVTGLGEGPVTHLFLADRLLELPLSLISVSLGTALLPTLARLWSQKEPEQMVSTANNYFRLNMFTALPAAAGLFSLGGPIVEVLFLRRKFTIDDAASTAMIVQIYGLTLLAASSVRVLVPSFYAIKNTKIPAVVSLVCLGAHLCMAPIFMRYYGVEGLVVSTLITAFLNLCLLMILHHRLIGPFGVSRIFKSMLRMLVPTLALYFVSQSYFPLYEYVGGGAIAKALLLFAVIGVSAAVYGILSQLFQVEEMKSVVTPLWNRLKGRLKKV